jgi:hypothetical protein
MSIPSRLTRDFVTGLTKAEFKQRFPYLDPDETLEGFLNYHISKGDRSHNWQESFLGFADWRNRKVRAERAGSGDTDSMGLPIDGIERAKVGASTEGDYGTRFLSIVEKNLALGMTFEQAHAEAVKELEGEST